MYSGKWSDTVGTYLFFEPELASAPVDPIFSDVPNKVLNYKYKTRKCLEISRVFINQRCNDESAEHNENVELNENVYPTTPSEEKENSKDIKKVS